MAGSKSFAEGLSQRRIFREVGPGRPRHNSNDDDLHCRLLQRYVLLLLGLSKNCRAEVSLRKRQYRLSLRFERDCCAAAAAASEQHKKRSVPLLSFQRVRHKA